MTGRLFRHHDAKRNGPAKRAPRDAALLLAAAAYPPVVVHAVFVYGTLKRGFPYFDIAMRAHRFIDRARTRDRYPLVIAGKWYSPVLIFEPGVGQRVNGELFEVSEAGLAELDGFEGTDSPAGYRRLTIGVEAIGSPTVHEAWTYVKDRARIDIIHSDMLAEYPLDPRYIPATKR